jgi:hypothetical protein
VSKRRRDSVRLFDSVSQSLGATERSCHKKEYKAPRLIEWGSIEELTAGTALPGGDGVFGSSTN